MRENELHSWQFVNCIKNTINQKGALPVIPEASCRVLSGEGGIRTHGGPKDHNGFRDRPIRPLWHLSNY